MMVLALTVALLFVMPAIFLWLGRMIEGLTSGRVASPRRPSKTVSELTGEEWFLRPTRPMFGAREESADVAGDATDDRLSASAGAGIPWYHKPLPPLFDGLKLLNKRRAAI
jgi:hypothetical protein